MMRERELTRFGPGETVLVMEGVATPEDKNLSPYLYLPFSVPEGVSSIAVRYSYDPAGILDIGLVDAEIEPFPARKGFRGWSGAARQTFFIGRDAATPGYVPGALPTGVWRVVLGLHRVPPGGCRYRVEVALNEPPPEDIDTRAFGRDAGGEGAPRDRVETEALPAPPGMVWCRGDLHSHTFHSDAKGSLEELVGLARANGLEFLAITDHNTASHHPFLAALQEPAFALLPGQEITTDRGHANVWGVDGWVDFRLHGDDDVKRLIEEVHERGGLISINHPKEGGPPWTYDIPDGFDCFEAWQMLWPMHNRMALDFYDKLLRQGRRLTLVGGSDWHQPALTGEVRVAGPWGDPGELRWVDGPNPGRPTTWLLVSELTAAGVMDALRRGTATVSESPRGPTAVLRAGAVEMGGRIAASAGESVALEASVRGAAGDELRWVGSRGVLREAPVDGDEFVDRFVLDEPTSYVRLEVYRKYDRGGGKAGAERVRALSNPVYIERP